MDSFFFYLYFFTSVVCADSDIETKGGCVCDVNGMMSASILLIAAYITQVLCPL